MDVVYQRDDKRRATHNEVERRRRDKINSWIVKLGKIIPECKQESVKGSFESQVIINKFILAILKPALISLEFYYIENIDYIGNLLKHFS